MCPSLGSVAVVPVPPAPTPVLCPTVSLSLLHSACSPTSPCASLTPGDSNAMQLQKNWENEHYLPRGRKVHLTSPLFQDLRDSDIITSGRLQADGKPGSPMSSVSRTLPSCSRWHFVQDVSSTQSRELAASTKACGVFVSLKRRPPHTCARRVGASIPLPGR